MRKPPPKKNKKNAKEAKGEPEPADSEYIDPDETVTEESDSGGDLDDWIVEGIINLFSFYFLALTVAVVLQMIHGMHWRVISWKYLTQMTTLLRRTLLLT